MSAVDDSKLQPKPDGKKASTPVKEAQPAKLVKESPSKEKSLKEQPDAAKASASKEKTTKGQTPKEQPVAKGSSSKEKTVKDQPAKQSPSKEQAPKESANAKEKPATKNQPGNEKTVKEQHGKEKPSGDASSAPADGKAETSLTSTQSASTESNNAGDSTNNENGENRPRRRRYRGQRSRSAYVPYGVLLRQHEEAQKMKKVLDTNCTGTVKWFSLRYHYGFIARDDGKGDVFVHQMNISKSRMNRVYLRSLAHDEKVEFDVVEGKAGPEASNVTGPNGSEVKGVYVIQLRFPIGSGNRRRLNTSGNNRRQRRQTDNEDNDDAPSPQGQRRNRRNRNRNRNRTISTTKPDALEKNINDVTDAVGAIRVAN